MTVLETTGVPVSGWMTDYGNLFSQSPILYVGNSYERIFVTDIKIGRPPFTGTLLDSRARILKEGPNLKS